MLRTRTPTGRVAWPLILVEGEEKAGKTYAALALSGSKRIGRSFVFDLGDGTADEYAALGDYEVVDLNGTYSDLVDQLAAAIAIPSDPDRPNLYVIDSGTQLWDSLKAWVDQRARRSKRAESVLAQDPDAEIDVPMNLWNDAKDRWHRVINMLRRAPGIAVITAQGSEVAKVENGVPVAGQTMWTIAAEKTTAASVTAWVRMRRDPRSATLIGARSLHVDIPAHGLPLPLEHTLEHVVFDILGAGGQFGELEVKPATVGIPVIDAKRRLLQAVVDSTGLTEDAARDEALALWRTADIPKDAQEISADQLAELLVLATNRGEE